MSETAQNIVRTTVRMSPQLHSTLTDFVHDLGKGLPPRSRPSIDSVIQEAIQKHIAAQSAEAGRSESVEPPTPAPELPAYPSEHARWHDMLEKVLKFGTEQELVAVQQIIRWASDFVEAREAEKRRKAS